MDIQQNKTVIGVDLGGTKILTGKVQGGLVMQDFKTKVPVDGSEKAVLDALTSAIDMVFDEHVSGIGIGVPSVVDVEKGIVYDVQNIPSWEEVHLREFIEAKYQIPVYINNDANCFAAGEKIFGKGQKYSNIAALIVGTGIAAGLVIHNKLYNGNNCGAGEFGMIPYLDHHFEYYCSGQFFGNFYDLDGETVFERAQNGDAESLRIFAEFGKHLGHAINTILYAVDPEIIIMGGSVSKAYQLFEKAMYESIGTFAYRSTTERLKIELSDNPDIALLGAAALCFQNISFDQLSGSEIKELKTL